MTLEQTSVAIAGFHALVIGSLALLLGYLVVDALARLFRIELDAPACWGLSLFGFTAVVTALTLIHIATAGAIFSNVLLTRALLAGMAIAAVAIHLLLRRPRSAEREGNRFVRWVPLLMLVLAYLLWTPPVFEIFPLDFRGDTKHHAIRASELLNGESTPSSILTGDIPNDYPYLFHAEAATLARVTPGGRILHAYGPIFVLLVGGAALALYALGRELRRWTGGVFLGVFGAFAGGFGWLFTRSPELVADPRNESIVVKYAGDFLTKRSYNLAFHNLAPPFPRDLSYALFGCFLLLLIMGLKRKSVPLLIGAGVTTGMLGLGGGEAFFVAMGISVLMIVIGGYRRLIMAAALLLPALVLYACWAVPMVLNYLEFGGFTYLGAAPVSLTPILVLGSWGLTTPFALYGAVCVLPELRSSLEARLLVVTLIVPAVAVLVTTLAGSTLPEGVATLGRPHRYWPLLYLGLALFASIGAALVVEWLGRFRWYVAVAASLILVVAAGASPFLASLAFGRQFKADPILLNALTGDTDSVLNIVSPEPRGNCVVAIPRSLSRAVPAYSGYRVVFYPGNPKHQARIRWPELQRKIPYASRQADNELLITGNLSKAHLDDLIDRYSLDIVVTEPLLPPAPVFQQFASVNSREGNTVVTLNPVCRAERFQRP